MTKEKPQLHGLSTSHFGALEPAHPALLKQPLNDDLVCERWLAYVQAFKAPTTARSYIAQCLRFRMWVQWHLDTQSPRALTMVHSDHIAAYAQYLTGPTPMPEYLLRRFGKARQPFNTSPLKTSSIRLVLTTLMGMYERFKNFEDYDGNPYIKFSPFGDLKGNVAQAVKIVAKPGRSTPALPTAKQNKVIPVALWRSTLSILQGIADSTPRNPAAQRMLWVVQLLYYSWFRRDEAARLCMGNFIRGPTGWRIAVVGKGSYEADIVAVDDLMTALQKYRVSNGLPPFPSPGETRPAVLPLRGSGNVLSKQIYECFKMAMRTVSLALMESDPESAELIRVATPHWMRHSGISHSADGNVDIKIVSRQARHGDIRTTAGIYYKPADTVSRSQLEDALKKQQGT